MGLAQFPEFGGGLVGECGKEAREMDCGRLNPDVAEDDGVSAEVERGDWDRPRKDRLLGLR